MKWFRFDSNLYPANAHTDILGRLDANLVAGRSRDGDPITMLCTQAEFDAISVALDAGFSEKKALKKLMPMFTRDNNMYYFKDKAFMNSVLYLNGYLGYFVITHDGTLKTFKFSTPTREIIVDVKMYVKLSGFNPDQPTDCFPAVYVNGGVQANFDSLDRAEKFAFMLYENFIQNEKEKIAEKFAEPYRIGIITLPPTQTYRDLPAEIDKLAIQTITDFVNPIGVALNLRDFELFKTLFGASDGQDTEMFFQSRAGKLRVYLKESGKPEIIICFASEQCVWQQDGCIDAEVIERLKKENQEKTSTANPCDTCTNDELKDQFCNGCPNNLGPVCSICKKNVNCAREIVTGSKVMACNDCVEKAISENR